MANRLLQKPKLLHNLKKLQYLTRHNNAYPATVTTTTTTVPLIYHDHHHHHQEEVPKIADINDHEKIFSSVSTTALLRASMNLNIAAIPPLVDFGTWLVKSKLMNENKLVKKVVLESVRHTFFEHFCAGEDSHEAVRCIERVNERGLRGMLVFAVEHTSDMKTCEENSKGFLETVEATRRLRFPSKQASSVVVKITAICPMNLLVHVSHLLRWQQKDPSFNLPWKLETLPIFSESSPLYHTLEKPEPLSIEEERQLQSGLDSLSAICEKCIEYNMPLTIDAEDTIVQPAIDYFTYSAAVKYSKGSHPLVYGTIQTYLKDAKDRLYLAAKAADKLGVSMGFKLVRGAYMSSEAKLANSLGFESPIHNTIQDTHACFDGCVDFMLENIANGSHGVILATHNIHSGQSAARKARQLGIKEGNNKLEFAQLYGMSDALSFHLKNEGFLVSKYMPFGPIEKVIPYLIRRAEENRGMLATSTFDRKLMSKELMRRLKASIV
ncbi:hypothetical protein ACFE04_004917 [Oxalis oulophora]